ncbi:hypothetical protein FKM82_014847 [Ascaphus truei]
MDSEITYAEIRFPQKPKNFKTGQGPSIRTTGITPAPRSLQIPLLRVLGVSCVLLIIVTTALTAHGIRCLNCPRGWSREGGSCYFFSTVEETWERSRVKCEEMGAKLVVINDSNEQIFITERILEKTHWLGCSDTNSEGSWKWVDGSEVILKFWETKQPDNWSNNEDCGTINSKRQGMQNWNDVHCEWQLRYICERIKDQIVFKTSQPFAM